MFSSDRNIEIIGKLIETVKHYLGLQAEYAKLGAKDSASGHSTYCCGYACVDNNIGSDIYVAGSHRGNSTVFRLCMGFLHRWIAVFLGICDVFAL